MDTSTNKISVKKARAVPTHPPVAEMVTEAIKALRDRKGSSLPAIKKYMSTNPNYRVDVVRLAPFIRKFLKGAVTSGRLVQTKGVGAAGSFKLGAEAKAEMKKKPVKKPVVKQSPAKAKKPVAKKAKSPAKAKKPVAKIAKLPAKAKISVAKKSPAKVKKPVSKKAKSPTKGKKDTAVKQPAVRKTITKKPAAE